MNSAREIENKLRIAQRRLVQRWPLYAHLAAGWQIEVSSHVATMGITVRNAQFLSVANAAFVEACSLGELTAVLLHEVNHVLLGHLLEDQGAYPDRRARLIAEEVTVNEFVPVPLPGEPILLSDYPQFPANESTASRYHRLAGKATAAGQIDALGAPKNNPAGQKNASTGQERPASAPISAPKNPASGVVATDDHSLWDDVKQSGAVARMVVAAAVRQACQQTPAAVMATLPEQLCDAIDCTARGELPGQQVIRLQSRRATVDWRRVLRNYIGRVCEAAPTLSRPSRRFPDLVGITPGCLYQPRRLRIAACLDTSGSMSVAIIGAIGKELEALARQHEVVVIQADVRVHSVVRFRRHDRLSIVHGRGGTDFRPAFKVARSQSAEVIIYFTDGHGPAPERPPRLPVLWCLTPTGVRPAWYGRMVHMRDEGQLERHQALRK